MNVVVKPRPRYLTKTFEIKVIRELKDLVREHQRDKPRFSAILYERDQRNGSFRKVGAAWEKQKSELDHAELKVLWTLRTEIRRGREAGMTYHLFVNGLSCPMCFIAAIKAKISCVYYLWKAKRDDLSMIPPMTVEQIWVDSFVRNEQLKRSKNRIKTLVGENRLRSLVGVKEWEGLFKPKDLPVLYWIGKP